MAGVLFPTASGLLEFGAQTRHCAAQPLEHRRRIGEGGVYLPGVFVQLLILQGQLIFHLVLHGVGVLRRKVHRLRQFLLGGCLLRGRFLGRPLTAGDSRGGGLVLNQGFLLHLAVPAAKSGDSLLQAAQ